MLAHPTYRDHIGLFITQWQNQAPMWTPQTVAIALHTAAYSTKQTRSEQTLELVWTGPGSALPLRRIDQVVLQMIAQAQHTLTIVSFAVYDIDSIARALMRALARRVRVDLIIEGANVTAGKVAYDSLAAFGPAIAAQAGVFRWPLEQRTTEENGRYGSLHAKCAIADEHVLFISSANLTHYALTLNMELGLLVHGGQLPQEVSRHFKDLIQIGVLTQVTQ